MKPGAKRETFRAVLTSGEVRSITVARGAEGWAEESFEGQHDTARDAALGYTAGMCWPLVELRGPGELTTAEQLAALDENRLVVDVLALEQPALVAGARRIVQAHTAKGGG